MTERRPALDRLPDWPRMMSRSVAAAYCGVSPNMIGKVYGVEPVRLNARRALYDRRDLDAAIDRKKGYAPENDKIMGAIKNASSNALR